MLAKKCAQQGLVDATFASPIEMKDLFGYDPILVSIPLDTQLLKCYLHSTGRTALEDNNHGR